MCPILCQQKAPQLAVGPTHSHPNSRQRPAGMKAARRTGPIETALAIPFLSPDPVPCLVGQSNEAPVLVDGKKVTALIDLGAQVSSISSGFCDLSPRGSSSGKTVRTGRLHEAPSFHTWVM